MASQPSGNCAMAMLSQYDVHLPIQFYVIYAFLTTLALSMLGILQTWVTIVIIMLAVGLFSFTMVRTIKGQAMGDSEE